ncbi:hypothetical protein VPH35_039806 [Triticum aestivum]
MLWLPRRICAEEVWRKIPHALCVDGNQKMLSMPYSDAHMRQHPIVDVQKGKQVVDYVQSCTTTRHSSDGRQKVRQKWEPPPANRVKLNVDGLFIPDGSAGTGMALRDSVGSSIFVACRYLFGCADAVDVELAAMEEGLALALQWSPLPVSVETDCAEAVALVQSSTPNMSRYTSRVQNIRELLKERDVSIVKISREANFVSHGLAQLGREQVKTAVWLRNFPQEIAIAMNTDCISIAS